MKARMAVGMSTLLLAACGGGGGGTPDAGPVIPESCKGSDQRSLRLGDGVGGAFEELDEAQVVSLNVAPQGGFGVTVLVKTAGLEISQPVAFELVPRVDGKRAGTFTIRQLVACQSDGSGGLLSGVVIGFDPRVYRSNDDLLELDGESVELVVTATDADGRSALARRNVVLAVGN